MLFIVVTVIAIVPLLVCERMACIALPVPVNGTLEARRAVDAQRESFVKTLFGLFWAVLGGWLIFIG